MLYCRERKWKMQLLVWDGWENRTRQRLTVAIGNSEIKWHEIKQRIGPSDDKARLLKSSLDFTNNHYSGSLQ